nr:MAG TPA: hypothetical protein [Caudoviricetes sp.]DAT55059.1 MAG TPA: hypothetical protein [Caudoviricetes sp.]
MVIDSPRHTENAHGRTARDRWHIPPNLRR